MASGVRSSVAIRNDAEAQRWPDAESDGSNTTFDTTRLTPFDRIAQVVADPADIEG